MDNKYQKALENLKQFNKHSFPVASLHPWFQTQLDSLQELVDKETPMKPDGCEYEWRHGAYGWICPRCLRDVISSTTPNYCPNCGQKIDWSDYD